MTYTTAAALGLAGLLAAAGCQTSPHGARDAGVPSDASGIPDGQAPVDAGPDAEIPCDPATEQCDPIPLQANPCIHERYWPLQLRSTTYPFIVHFQSNRERTTAEALVGHIEYAWQVGVEQLGFSAPLPDNGECGPDDAFDVFLWRGLTEAYTLALAENAATPHDDWVTYMAIDPAGPYGGPLFPVTAAHELNHAMQAADDWWEPPIIFEMTAVFFEEIAYPDVNDYVLFTADFQDVPDWSIDRDDGYDTWYMYSAALYLHFLRDRYFSGDASFVADMWRGCRNPSGTNEPDFADSLGAMLQTTAGVSYFDSVAEFARWRWYTGSRHDGAHFPDGAAIAEVALAADIASGTQTVVVDPAPMMLGNAYVRITRGAGPDLLSLSLVSAAPEVRWVVQAVPSADGTADGEYLDLSGGSALVDLSTVGERTIVVTALPAGPDDPDNRTDARYPVTLELTAQ